MLHSRRFLNDAEMSLFLRGAVPLGGLDHRKLLPIAGLELDLFRPSVSHTFTAGANPRGLTVKEFIQQVNQEFDDLLKVEQQGGQFFLVEKNPVSGIALDDSSQPIRAILGLGEGFRDSPVIHPVNGSRAPRLVNVTGSQTGVWVFWEDTMEGSLGPTSDVQEIADPATENDPPAPILLGKVSRGIHVGGAGNLVVRFPGSTSFVSYLSVSAGTYMRIAVDAISETSTATALVVEY